MAQKSKKYQIASAALPLFLENGFKGTSIDLVVRESEVSKATVYNHYPDKAALMLAALKLWIEASKPLISPVGSRAGFDEFVGKHWLSEEAVRIYALVIGEGWRFPEAKQLFWAHFDQPWRQALEYLCKQSGALDGEDIEQLLDHLLLQRLKNL